MGRVCDGWYTGDVHRGASPEDAGVRCLCVTIRGWGSGAHPVRRKVLDLMAGTPGLPSHEVSGGVRNRITRTHGGQTCPYPYDR